MPRPKKVDKTDDLIKTVASQTAGVERLIAHQLELFEALRQQIILNGQLQATLNELLTEPEGEPDEPLPDEFDQTLDRVPEPPRPVCERCGHEKVSHEPLNEKTCFESGCQCRGWKGG